MFLLDDKRISEINMVSGRTKKRTPKLHPLLNSVVTMASSHNGEFNASAQSKTLQLLVKSENTFPVSCCFFRYVALWTFGLRRAVSMEQG